MGLESHAAAWQFLKIVKQKLAIGPCSSTSVLQRNKTHYETKINEFSQHSYS